MTPGSSTGPGAVKFSPFLQLGTPGLKQYSGFIVEEFLTVLRGKRAAEAYKEIMSNSSIASGILDLFDLTMRGVEKFVEPYSEKGGKPHSDDEYRAERIEGALDDTNSDWSEIMSEISSMLGYGFAPMEPTYKKCQGYHEDPMLRSKYNDGVIAWSEIALRGQDTLFRWDYDADNRLRGMIQTPPPDYRERYIPIEKLLLFRPKIEKQNPEGKSLLRAAYYEWIHIKRLTEYESIKGERDATGIPVIWIPAENMLSGATQDQANVYNLYKRIAKNLKNDDQAGLVMPMLYNQQGNPMFKVEVLQGQGRSIFDYSTAIIRHEVRMAMCLLNDALMIGHDKVGSYGMADSKVASTPEAAVNAWLDAVYGVINRVEIPRVYALNGWPLDRLCKVKHGAVRAADLDRLAKTILSLTQAGMALFPDDGMEDYIRDEAGWPKKAASARSILDAALATPGTPNDAPGANGVAEGATKRHALRARTGKWDAARAASRAEAVALLAARREVAANGVVQHGFRMPDQIPFDPKAMCAVVDAESLPLERVKLSTLLATQPGVKRETVRRFVDNPDTVPAGHRDLTGRLSDRPIIARHRGDHYILDGHHRLASKMLLGYETAMVRVASDVDGDGTLVMKDVSGPPHVDGLQDEETEAERRERERRERERRVKDKLNEMFDTDEIARVKADLARQNKKT